MGKEIERKFLVVDERWRGAAHDRRVLRQGYLANTGRASVRVRVAGERAYLNIKSMTLGVTRHEYEYPIPVAEAEEMLGELCQGPLIEKERYLVEVGDHTWEVDEFFGDNAGLIVAEVELEAADQPFTKPEWAGEEVSDDPRYYNVKLVEHPFKDW
jgi:adenylate cyclase